MSCRPNKTGRNTSDHYTLMRRWIMETPAWRALSPKAQALYPWLKLEWHGPKQNNNGKIRLSVRQAAKCLGISVNAANKAFHELQAKGFLHVTEAGALGIKGLARGPSYELTELPLPSHLKGRHLFCHWESGSDFKVVTHNCNNPAGLNGRRNPIVKSVTVLSSM